MVSKKGLLLTVCSLGILLSHTMPAYAINIEHLPGYSRMTVGQSFEEYLKKNPALVKVLSENQQLSKAVMRNASLQSQLVQGKITPAEIFQSMQPQPVTPEKTETTPALQAASAASIDTTKTQTDSRLAAAPVPQDKLMLSQDIAANLIVANEVSNNPALARYFERHPEAYQKVRDGSLRLEDISLTPTTPTALSVTGKNDGFIVAAAKLHEPAHLESDIACIGFDIRFQE